MSKHAPGPNALREILKTIISECKNQEGQGEGYTVIKNLAEQALTHSSDRVYPALGTQSA